MSTWDILQIFLILGLMTGILYGLLYFVKKYFYSFDKRGDSNTKINVISTQAILPKKYVSVIQFNNITYVLGVSEQSVNLIDKIDDCGINSSNENSEPTQKPNFLTLLKKNMGIG